ncbi:macrophage mannose receptor 1b isoform X2 [Triplophysa dalaica]|uniref:macrophage mannose receptor 1b isoform X2 n=1 Tax=Triplophysa dalaica TaxID=1582913 RepID=UPI0024DF5331|nr:macrophage mannose receptor 1b isoform X2 [Triplophysa dalaica]
MWSTDCTENKPGASHCYGDHEDENSSSCYFAFSRSVELLCTVRLSYCDPHAISQQFRWISNDRIMNIVSSQCLGVGSKTVGRTLQWLKCEENNKLQQWECIGDSKLNLKNESLNLAASDTGVPYISKNNGTESKLTIHGTLNSICSRPYEEVYTIDGNAFGRPCYFPFKYQNKWYSDCTKDGAQSQRLWCSVESEYKDKELWGYCPTPDNTFWSKNPLTNVFYQLNDKSALTWHQARKSCQQQGAELLSVSEPHEHTFVSGMTVKTQNSLWTGLNKLDVSSGWQWSNGQPLRYLKWSSGFPTTQPDYSCGVLRTQYSSEWTNEHCFNRQGYICQRGHSVPTVPPVVHTGFCQSPWIPYSGHCYLLHRNKKTWLEARGACLREEGDLLSVLNTEEQSFVITQLGYLKTDELWIGFNDRKTQMLFEWSDQSSVPFASWEVGEPSHNAVHAEDCVFMRGEEGKWSDEICERKHGFICKKKTSSTASNNDTVVTSPGCKTGWSRYGYYCYMAGSETKTFEEAKQMCEKAGSHLVDIASRVENAFLVSLVGARPEKYFWTGLSNQKDLHTYEWTNTKKVPYTHFNAGMPGRKQGCVAMTTGLLAGLWDVISCSNKEKYICKQPAEGLVTTQAPPTTPALGCSEGWIPVGNRDLCVKLFDVFSSQLKTWSDALDYCRELGGDLLSIHQDADIPWKLSGHPAWIGYSIQDPSVGYVWSDGSASSYQNWASDEPNNLNNMENCVEMRISWWKQDGVWNDVNCQDKKDWYCQIPKGKTPKEVNVTEPVYNVTEDGWIEFKGNQYLMSEYPSLSVKEARIKCKKGHGDLVVINDEEERVFIWHQTKAMFNGIIIGLAVDLDGSYQWMDGSPVVYKAWEENQPSLLNSEERCVKMTRTQGLWETINCGEEFSYVCKRSESPPVNATVAPTEEPKGGCAPEWKKFDTKCYIMRDDLKTWKDAREYCREMGGDLVSILNRQQQAYFTTMVSNTTTNFWIGFSNLANGRFRWTDGSTVEFTAWARGEPETNSWPVYSWERYHFSNDQKCTVLGRGSGTGFGMWVATDCNSTQGFICSRHVDPALTPVPFQFPETYFKIGNSSLKMIQRNQTWSEANRTCNADTAQLVSIRSSITQAYAELQVFRTKQPVWIGLNSIQTSGYFSWSSNWHMNMEKWAYGEPQQNHPCVYMDVDGQWRTALCNETFNSICEQTTEIPPSPPVQYPGQCPATTDESPLRWIPFRDSCYAFVKDLQPWSRASRLCLTWGASLVSIMDKAEHRFIENNLFLLESYEGFWIGLFKTSKGHWLWLDGNVVDYTNWENVENMDEEETMEDLMWDPTCTHISTETKRWRKKHCDHSYMSFICKTAKVIPPTTKAPVIGPPEPHRVYTGLAVFLAIAGFGVLGVLAYIYIKKNPKRLSLPAFENPAYGNIGDALFRSKDSKALIDNIEIAE